MPVVTLDDEGRIRRITGPAADLLGVAPEDAHERPFSLFAPDFGETINNLKIGQRSQQNRDAVFKDDRQGS